MTGRAVSSSSSSVETEANTGLMDLLLLLLCYLIYYLTRSTLPPLLFKELVNLA